MFLGFVDDTTPESQDDIGFNNDNSSEILDAPEDFGSTVDNHQSTEDSVKSTADLDQTQIDINEVEKSEVENEVQLLKAKVYHLEKQQVKFLTRSCTNLTA